MNPEAILLEETRSRVRFLRMNRPETKNALSNDLIRALIRGFEAAASEGDVRVVALTGNGGAFSSGAEQSPSKPGDLPRDSVGVSAARSP